MILVVCRHVNIINIDNRQRSTWVLLGSAVWAFHAWRRPTCASRRRESTAPTVRDCFGNNSLAGG